MDNELDHSTNHKPRRVSTQPTNWPTEADLAAAFSDDDAELENISETVDIDSFNDSTEPQDANSAKKSTKSAQKLKKTKHPLSKLRKISIAVLCVGVVALIAGISCLVYNLLAASNTTDDADFLVSVKSWQREDEPSVVWQFTEVGKGVLTTNASVNEYDFTWLFEDGKLKIDTDWLYTLNDEYDYKIDQNARTLTLTTDDQTITFVPAESEN